MSPCHGEDRQFKSDQGRHFFKNHASVAQLVEQRTEIRVSTVRFCLGTICIPCGCGGMADTPS